METLRIYDEIDMLGHVQEVGPYLQQAAPGCPIILWSATPATASTGRPSGELQTRLRLDQFDEALEAAAKWQDIFGKENYFLELMDHGLDIERRVRDGLTEIARKLRIPPVVTNDSHYTREADSQAQDMLLCIQTGMVDTDRLRFDGSGYYIKPAAEMYSLDSSDLWQEGCRKQPAADRRPSRHHRHVRLRQLDAQVPHPG